MAIKKTVTGEHLKTVRKFIRESDHLTVEHQPMVVLLKSLALTLDDQIEETGKVEERTAALFGTTWNRLKKPVETNAAKDEESGYGLTFS